MAKSKVAAKKSKASSATLAAHESPQTSAKSPPPPPKKDDAQSKVKDRISVLCAEGNRIHIRLCFENNPKMVAGNETIIEKIKSLPAFRDSYQRWYTEALELLRQTFPSRVDDFISYLNPPKTRKSIDSANYTISDALRGIRITRGPYNEVIVDASAANNPMEQQVKIIESVRDSIDSVLVNLRSELQANLFDEDIDAARELNGKGFPRAAGMIAGVVMEGHLREMAARHQVSVSAKNPTISTLNDALKDAGILDIHVWRRVQAVGDVRNNCGHKGANDPAKADVARMIDDVADLIKRIS